MMCVQFTISIMTPFVGCVTTEKWGTQKLDEVAKSNTGV